MSGDSPKPARNLEIVVVDDEPDVAAYVGAVLEQRGHRVHVARNAREGMEMIRVVRPDVVCLDIVMPEETGVSLLRRIRADRQLASTPVLFLTALSREMVASGGSGYVAEILAEPDGYIEKPPDAAALVETVERVATATRAEAR